MAPAASGLGSGQAYSTGSLAQLDSTLPTEPLDARKADSCSIVVLLLRLNLISKWKKWTRSSIILTFDNFLQSGIVHGDVHCGVHLWPHLHSHLFSRPRNILTRIQLPRR